MKARISFTVAVGIALFAFAAPANATHVDCGDTLTTDTVLDSDIVCADTDFAGLVIGANGITVWFNGHKLSSPTPDIEDTGIITLENAEFDDVTIRGGTIEGFFNGARVRGADFSVMRTTVTNTGCSNGIVIEGDRAYAYRNTVITPVDPSCGGFGIYIGRGLGTGGTDSYAWGNTVRGGGFGVRVGGPNARAVLNFVSDCAETGIKVDSYDDTHAVASHNIVTGCETGIANHLDLEAQSGNGRFRRNLVNLNFYGMSITDRSAIVGANTARANLVDGILVQSPGTLIGNNTANENGAVGINAAAGVIDGGGNTALFNGLDDCINVSCGP